MYEEFAEEVKGEATYGNLADLARASCLEEKGDLKDAIDILRPMADQPEASFRELAMWNLARVYRMDGREKEAKTALQEFVEAYPDSLFSPMAKALL